MNDAHMFESEVVQSCPTLCDPIDCSLPGSSVHGIFPGNSTGVDCHFLLQGIFPTQGSNPGLPHCRQMLYRLSHQGSHMFRGVKIGDDVIWVCDMTEMAIQHKFLFWSACFALVWQEYIYGLLIQIEIFLV